jgi:hypothetical protein
MSVRAVMLVLSGVPATDVDRLIVGDTANDDVTTFVVVGVSGVEDSEAGAVVVHARISHLQSAARVVEQSF